jgi:uncharacterized membrane protein HdeD (DUF308 family)/pimeloyl-ACP methyl ester carboxylesterase
MARRLPWWLVLVLGIGCVVLGVVLTAEPFTSLAVLAGLVALGLIFTGLTQVLSAASTSRPWLARIVGVIWIVAGITAASWPGITIGALAVAVGIGLVVGGVVKIAVALFGDDDERFILGLSGLTNVVVGILAVSWPAVTVLVLAVIFGVRTIVFGISQIALALKMRRSPERVVSVEGREWPRWLRLTGGVLALALALGGMAISVAIHRAQPGDPGPFYTAPSPLPDGPPGTIIRREVIDPYYPGTTTYRVLYLSTGYDGKPTATSGIVVIPDGPAPPGGRKILAYTHGTTGVASRCAPSLRDGADTPLTNEGGALFAAAGYVIAATDYQGLGTKGPHPYLVGESEAMGALDSVRAAHNLPGSDAGTDFVVWGHSQGGHASLFAGQLAPTYAPELHLIAVAAGGPVPDLIALFKFNLNTQIGKVLISMALHAWSEVYAGASLNQIVEPAAQPLVAKIARNCLYTTADILASVPAALVLNLTFLSTPAWDVEPWKTIAADNDPGQTATAAPVLLVQGLADTIVDPTVTEQFATDQCGKGQQIDLLTLPGVGHIATGHDAAPQVAQWVADRFAGRPAPTTC